MFPPHNYLSRGTGKCGLLLCAALGEAWSVEPGVKEAKAGRQACGGAGRDGGGGRGAGRAKKNETVNGNGQTWRRGEARRRPRLWVTGRRGGEENYFGGWDENSLQKCLNEGGVAKAKVPVEGPPSRLRFGFSAQSHTVCRNG